MQRIRQQDEISFHLAGKVLSWISNAYKVLTIVVVQHAISVEPGDTSFDEDGLTDESILVDVCAGLVAIDHESRTIRLIHYTTQDYFERTRSSNLPNAQTYISRTCLTYLNFDEFAGGYCVSTTGFGEETNESFRAQTQKYRFLQYAIKHWSNHVSESQEDELMDSVLDLLAQKAKFDRLFQAIDPPVHWQCWGYQSYRSVNGLSMVSEQHISA